MVPRELIGIAVIIAVITILGVVGGRPGQKGEYIRADRSFPTVKFWRGEADGDAKVRIYSASTGSLVNLGDFLLDDGELYWHRDGNLRAEVVPSFYWVDPTRWDLGVIAAYGPGRPGTRLDDFSAGIRVSPVRIGSILSIDGALTPDWVGFGASVYPAFQSVPRSIRNIGIGAWYGFPLGDEPGGPDRGWNIGLSLSTRH